MNYLRYPALHFLFIGAGLFSIVGVLGGMDESLPPIRIEIPHSKVTHLRQQFFERFGRPPTSEEESSIRKTLEDEEILFQYALHVGLQKESVVKRRLAQIAAFVSSNHNSVKPQEELASNAMALGLHHGDLVTRRILIDGARRLIRAAVRVRRPTQEMLEAYLRNHQQEFLLPSKTRLTHVMVNRIKHGKGTEARITALLKKIIRESYSPTDAAKLGDHEFVPASLPMLNDMDLTRKFGYQFVRQLANIPTGTWGGPIPSRYGQHLVYIHGRQESYVPPLSRIKQKVRSRLIEKLANEWLKFRLAQLRGEFEIVITDPIS